MRNKDPICVFNSGKNVAFCLLTGWTAERVQEYFVWAAQVVKGLRGTNAALEEKLLQLFKERDVHMWQWSRSFSPRAAFFVVNTKG